MDIDQRTKLHPFAAGAANLQPTDVLGPHAIVGGGLDIDLPVTILEGEIVHIGRAKIGLQRGVNLVQRDPLRLRFFPVDLQVKLRLSHAEG